MLNKKPSNSIVSSPRNQESFSHNFFLSFHHGSVVQRWLLLVVTDTFLKSKRKDEVPNGISHSFFKWFQIRLQFLLLYWNGLSLKIFFVKLNSHASESYQSIQHHLTMLTIFPFLKDFLIFFFYDHPHCPLVSSLSVLLTESSTCMQVVCGLIPGAFF